MATGNDKNQSPIIAHRLPEFVQTDHPTMVAFIQAYYEWLDQQADQGYVRTPAALDGLADVDKTIEEFVGAFKKEYLLGFPEELAVDTDGNTVDTRQLIKNIKEFYRNKGTEKTYEFLFRVLYDTAVEFYYPSRDILRLSDGKWIQKYSIRCSNDLGSKIFEARGKTVAQRSIDGSIVASGRVIDVTTYLIGSRKVAELFLTNINGRFQSNTAATTNFGGIEFTDNSDVVQRETFVYPVLSTVSVSSQGSNYRKGDRIFFQPSITPYKQNLLKWSQKFNVSNVWIAANNPSLLSTTIAAPDSSYTATRFNPSSLNSGTVGNHVISQSFAVKQNKWYTLSIYAKADEYSGGVIRFQTSSSSIFYQSYYTVRSSNPVFTTGFGSSGSVNSFFDPTSLNRSITSVGNGWYRITYTGKWIGADDTANVFYFFGRHSTTEGSPQTASTAYGMYIWGAQVNEYDSAPSSTTPYLKTEGIAPLSVAATNDTGQGAIATITDVDGNGGILKTRIDNFGIGYEISPLTTFDSAFGSGGAVSTTLGTLCTYPGYYSNNDGRLSTNKVMQDNHYYQNFSYVLLTEVVIDRYKDILRRLIHPAGMGMFGKVVVNRCAAETIATDTVAKRTDLNAIGNYSPYTLYTYTNMGEGFFDSRPTPYFPSLHDLVIAGSTGNPSISTLQSYSKGEKKNLVNWSNDATTWMPSNANFSTTPNYDIAPDGTTTASLVTKITPTASVLHRTINPIGISPPFTYSLYFKQPTSITGSLTGGFAVRNDSILQTLISSSFEFLSPPALNTIVSNSYGYREFTQEANDWYRVKMTITGGVTSGDQLLLYYGDTNGAMIPNGTSLLVWGMQLEPGLTANPLVKTTSNPIANKPYAVSFTPKGITGLKIWLDGKTLTGAVGATVGAWVDSSGNGFTASASLQNRYPTVSDMGGLLLTGSSGTFGSVLTTPSLQD
jgi:hypothetical protein